MGKIKDYIRENPFIYDRLYRLKRAFGKKDPLYTVLNNHSLKHGRRIRFIQIGANDGLRNDPVREFVFRDNWSGIFIEPVPYAFEELKRNYAGYTSNKLVFVNAAITDTPMTFWTFKSSYLDILSKEDRMDHLRKSSFSKEHLSKFFGHEKNFDEIIDSIPIKCLNFKELIENFWNEEAVDLVVIDAEGHEEAILRDMFDSGIRPKAIFYENHNLADGDVVECQLKQQGYSITYLGGDAFAQLSPEKPQ